MDRSSWGRHFGGFVVLVLAEYFLFRANFKQYFSPDGIFVMHHRFHRFSEFLSGLVTLDVAHWYRPLSYRAISALFYPLFGLRPYGYHVVMFGLFAVTTCMFYAFVTWLTQRELAGAVAAFYFGIHTNNVYTTFDFAFTPDLCYGLLYICSVWCFAKFFDSGDRRWRIASGACFVFSLMCKEAAVTLPGVLFAYHFIFVQRKIKDSILAVLPHLSILAVYLIYVVGYLHVGGADYMLVPGRVPGNITTAFYTAFNLRRMGLMPVHGTAPAWALLYFVLFGAVALVAIAGILGFGERNRVFVVFGLSWFVLAMVPVLPLNSGIGAYYLFLPGAGFALAVTMPLVQMYDYLNTRADTVAAGLALGSVLLLLWLACRSVVVADMLQDASLGYGARWASISAVDMKRTYSQLPHGTEIYILNEVVSDMWRYHGIGALFKLLYNDDTITTSYLSLGESPRPGEHQLVVMKVEADHLVEVTPEFITHPELFRRNNDDAVVEYDANSQLRLLVEPTVVTAAKDFYSLTIPGLNDEKVEIEYRLDKGPVARLTAQLDPAGKIRFFVSALTHPGTYEFSRFRRAGAPKWTKSSASVRVINPPF